jgi:hypothetical protein
VSQCLECVCPPAGSAVAATLVAARRALSAAAPAPLLPDSFGSPGGEARAHCWVPASWFENFVFAERRAESGERPGRPRPPSSGGLFEGSQGADGDGEAEAEANAEGDCLRRQPTAAGGSGGADAGVVSAALAVGPRKRTVMTVGYVKCVSMFFQPDASARASVQMARLARADPPP